MQSYDADRQRRGGEEQRMMLHDDEVDIDTDLVRRLLVRG